jgi:membrane-bound lytic murein transglycosylase D
MIPKKIIPRNQLYFLMGIFCLAGTMTLLLAYTYSTNANETLNNLRQNVTGINLNRSFEFAGEPVLMNEDTRERLDRELSINAYLQSTSLLNLKMSARYFPQVEKVLQENGIPEDFKYLAIAESGFRNLTSSANAKGYWQFMGPAAKEMGLEVTDEVDERLHIEKSTQAACLYIKKLHKRFGTWTNAAAAYNIGPTAFAKYVAEQKEPNYYHMHLNDETSRYVFRILAIKDIVRNPQDYGYFLADDHRYKPHANLREVSVQSDIPSLVDFAQENKTTYRLLKYYNPWLTGKQLTVKPGKTYTLKLPEN